MDDAASVVMIAMDDARRVAYKNATSAAPRIHHVRPYRIDVTPAPLYLRSPARRHANAACDDPERHQHCRRRRGAAARRAATELVQHFHEGVRQGRRVASRDAPRLLDVSVDTHVRVSLDDG